MRAKPSTFVNNAIDKKHATATDSFNISKLMVHMKTFIIFHSDIQPMFFKKVSDKVWNQWKFFKHSNMKIGVCKEFTALWKTGIWD